jgi:hypothetical protein
VIRGIGFFQFVENQWGDPIGSLEEELRNSLPGRDFLIVLPEAFNLGADYNGKSPSPPRIPAKEALAQLAGFSRDYGVVFVTSVLEAIDDRIPSKYLNSACLVDHDLGTVAPWRLLCHKREDDRSKRYEPCPDETTNCRNPSHCQSVYVGALICRDIQQSIAMQTRLKEHGGTTVLCVPAWMNNDYFQHDTVSPLFPPGSYWVLANSNPIGCRSFITNRRGRKVEPLGADGKNCLVVKTWAELEEPAIDL